MIVVPSVVELMIISPRNCRRRRISDGARLAPTVHESNVFIPFGLLLSEKRFPDLLERFVVRDGWNRWSRVQCAQGRRTYS